MTSHAVMGLVQVELRGELSSKELALAELQYDSDGHLLQGSPDEPFYRFHKISLIFHNATRSARQRLGVPSTSTKVCASGA